MSERDDYDAARMRAWETRRARYGAAGHAGPYHNRTAVVVDDLGRLALAFILRLHAQGELSEGQCSKALQIDRVSFRELVDREGPRCRS